MLGTTLVVAAMLKLAFRIFPLYLIPPLSAAKVTRPATGSLKAKLIPDHTT
jgi:hypothetical protein